jgi:hypothetical protein
MFFMALMACFFSIPFGKGWYFHNDGVTIACSMEPLSYLIHPGRPEVLGCTYDHQPFYHVLLKLVGHLFSYDLLMFQ